MRKLKQLLLLCGTFFLLCSCSLGEEGAPREAVSLTLVSFGGSRDLTEQVNLFNETHEGYRIDIEIYELNDVDKEIGLRDYKGRLLQAEGLILSTTALYMRQAIAWVITPKIC